LKPCQIQRRKRNQPLAIIHPGKVLALRVNSKWGVCGPSRNPARVGPIRALALTKAPDA